jgi:hypothetical protein
MTKQDLDNYIEIIESFYTNFWKNKSPSQIAIVKQGWFACFQNVPYEIMQKALYEYMVVDSKFPPAISDITTIINDQIMVDDNDTADDSFEKVLKLANRKGYSLESVRDSLNEFELRIVNDVYLRELGSSKEEHQSIMKAQYRNRYNAIKDSEIRLGKVGLSNRDSQELLEVLANKGIKLLKK